MHTKDADFSRSSHIQPRMPASLAQHKGTKLDPSLPSTLAS